MGFDYHNSVFDYLEYLGLDEYIKFFNPEDVALTFAPVISSCKLSGCSSRMAALILFGHTWNKIKNNININYGHTLN